MAQDFDRLHTICFGNMTGGMFAWLSDNLGVSVESLRAMQVGYAPVVPFAKQPSYDGWFTAPQRSGSGKVVGLSLRHPFKKDKNGSIVKSSYPGGKSGGFYVVNPEHQAGDRYSPGAHNWRRTMDLGTLCPVCGKPDGCLVSAENPADPRAVTCIRATSPRPTKFGYLHILKAEGQLAGAPLLAGTGPVLVVEGMSDACAAYDMGVVAVGRASNLAGLDVVVDLVRGRDVIVLGENDRKANGDWPGKVGLIRALERVQPVCPSARGVMPPDHVKDLRPWRSKFGMTDVKALLVYVDAHGQTLGEMVDAQAKIIVASTPILQDRAADLVKDALRPTDLGNAANFAIQHGGRVRYVEEWKSYARYEGGRWGRCSQLVMADLAGDTARRLREAARDEDAVKWAEQTESESHLTAMVRLAASYVREPASKFDADPWVLNTPEGLIDLRTGATREGRPEDRCTKLTRAAMDPDAPTPLWDAFLNRVLSGDTDLLDYVQKLAGHCFTGDTSEQFLHIFEGGGSDGKSVLVETLMDLAGGYASGADEGLLALAPGSDHPTGATVMAEARLVVVSETDRDRQLKAQAMKRLTGDAMVTSRKMHQDFTTLPRTGKLILLTNNPLVITENTYAVWRRIRRVPFTASIRGDEVDTKLKDKLRAEYPGILAWVVRGCLAWQRDGKLNAPAAVRESTDAYQQDQDTLGQFIQDCCVVAADEEVQSSDLHAAYVAFMKLNGAYPLGVKRFKREMERRKFALRKSSRTRNMHWFGLDLLEHAKLRGRV